MTKILQDLVGLIHAQDPRAIDSAIRSGLGS